MNEYMLIGKVASVHGIAGEIKINPMTDDAERFFELEYLLLNKKEYTIEKVRLHKNQVLVKLEGIDDRNASEKLKGYDVEIYREDAVELDEGEYFIEDLKGLQVYDTSSSRKGVLKDIFPAGGADVMWFVVEGKDILMPFFNDNIKEINIEEGYIKADLSKGVAQ